MRVDMLKIKYASGRIERSLSRKAIESRITDRGCMSRVQEKDLWISTRLDNFALIKRKESCECARSVVLYYIVFVCASSSSY